ncbi:hypothetical protein GCM10011515_13610 [Tsuneonella deserti]|uniref:Uncharacterized protein n=1 Tax=Tsuneonella deserti TaxID=2035528 RepID=A0ABQ1S5G0_9SPHN|nr:hypothetical protein [Tsuneonella deserti]GGD95068.1 hypothetical protein GCM10011515_13610 [Tsuneonella deserti]
MKIAALTALLLATGTAVFAQDVPTAGATTETTTTTTVPTANGNGAEVSRTTETTTTTDDAGSVSTTASTQQSVTTPSGITNTVNRAIDALGKTTTTTGHVKADASAHVHPSTPKKPK